MHNTSYLNISGNFRTLLGNSFSTAQVQALVSNNSNHLAKFKSDLHLIGIHNFCPPPKILYIEILCKPKSAQCKNCETSGKASL